MKDSELIFLMSLLNSTIHIIYVCDLVR